MYLAYQNKGRNNAIILVCVGIIWEIFEHMSGKKRPTWLGGCSFGANAHRKWWYGRYSDIFSNLLGIILGNYIK